MNYVNKSRKSLLMLTMLTILSTASVITVYAILIKTFEGGDVTIGGGATGTVSYSLDNSAGWLSTLSPASPGAPWYSKLNIDGGQFSGSAVTINWQLQRKMSDTSWSNVTAPTITSITLGASAQDVYASATGVQSENRDWGSSVTLEGTYRVLVTVNSA